MGLTGTEMDRVRIFNFFGQSHDVGDDVSGEVIDVAINIGNISYVILYVIID